MKRLPSLFVSHGAPTFALEPGLIGPRLTALAQVLPRPAAVLIVSPHWMTRDPQVMTTARPRTLYDFGGFDSALYDITYPVDGSPALAARAIEMLHAAGWPAAEDRERGLDHGAWVPLTYLYSRADVPVFQVSIPAHMDATSAFEYGRALAPLASEGVLIVGSGSLTHNLYEYRPEHGRGETYAAEFAGWIRDAVISGDHERLVRALEIAPHARRAHPTSEHYLPLVIAAGAASDMLPATVLDGGIAHGVLSMDAFVFGMQMPQAASENSVARMLS